jgi:biotin synthase
VKVRPCAFAGANSIFAGDKLLTTPNPDVNDDMEMFEMLGLTPQNHLQKFLSLLQLS